MVFFIRQLQTYAHLVVIESGWMQLSEFLKKKEGDLDSLIQAHGEYLGKLLTRVLLLRDRKGKEVSQDKPSLIAILIILRYRNTCTGKSRRLSSLHCLSSIRL